MAEENHTIRLLTEMHKEIRETRDEMREGFDEVDKRFEEAREERSALRQRMVVTDHERRIRRLEGE